LRDGSRNLYKEMPEEFDPCIFMVQRSSRFIRENYTCIIVRENKQKFIKRHSLECLTEQSMIPLSSA
jgi:hypothetical protein